MVPLRLGFPLLVFNSTRSLVAAMSTTAKPAVRCILGTMAIPKPLSAEDTSQALTMLRKAGCNEIDTALMYQGSETERVLGEVGVQEFVVATKANPWYHDGKTCNEPMAGLAPDLVEEQLRSSLKSLKLPKVQLFYLHAPDHDTDLLATLGAVDKLCKEGLFEEWGLSNYSAWEVVHIWHLCRENGFVKPSCYQGMYNMVTRAVEAELLPALRAVGMRFNAYNPLAGGILTGRYSFDGAEASGRFNTETVWGQRYRERFWHKSTFDALEGLRAACDKHGISLTDAALRWLSHHSQLDGANEDGVIIGGSSLDHIAANLGGVAGSAPLPQQVKEECERAWEASRRDCPPYFR